MMREQLMGLARAEERKSWMLKRRAAEAAAASVQVNLGIMFEYSTGVAQDRAEAIRLYRLAAAQGDA
jgi:TPR repeat protein